MTVTYTAEVASCKYLGCFLRLLARWKGSIYKILWLDIIIYLALYFSINLIYRFTLHDEDKKSFENLVRYCAKYANLIPLSFVLGFYVALVMERWWKQYTAVPYPDTIALLVGCHIKGNNEEARLIKRTIMRQVCLSFTLTLTMISPKVKKRFPDLESLIEAGLLHQEEKDIFDELDHEEYPSQAQYWLPLAWASNLVVQAKTSGLISNHLPVKSIIAEINKFRVNCGTLLDFDWISIPLVYTQVVTLAVYSYFLTTLISRQTLEANEENVVDLVFPIFTILEYFFYVGWLKVAESLINPFGEDDDDFEVVWLIDRNVQMSYTIVDRITQPKLKKDKYWAQKAPATLPYTAITKKYLDGRPVPSTRNIIVKDRKMMQPDGMERQLRRRHTISRTGNVSSLIGRFRNRNTKAENSLEMIEEGKKKLLHRNSEPIIQDIPVIEMIDKMENFNSLKEKRQEERKEKMLKYLDLIQKRRPTTENEKIIEEILLSPKTKNP